MKKKVNILLSAYNGEKYIAQQLDSLLAQTWQNIEIHVRDDGSGDGTVEILRRYERDHGIRVYTGENLGFRRSFMWLVNNCGGADYYAFCDQDDIWLPEKVETSVRALRKKDDIPALYLSDFYWSDEEANPGKRNRGAWRSNSLEKYITSGGIYAFGFTMLFNEAAAKGIRGHDFGDRLVHDQIVYMYCMCRGEVIWGKKPLAYYRRYGTNASVHEYVGGNVVTHFFWRVKTFLLHSGRDRVYARFQDFLDVYEKELDPETVKRMKLYLNEGHNLQKAAFKGRYRDTLTDEIQIRIMFLLGRI